MKLLIITIVYVLTILLLLTFVHNSTWKDEDDGQ